MSTDYLPKITPRDLGILETMADRGIGGSEMLTGAIRRKLQLAQIVFADDLPANVVTLGTRVAFRIDEQPAQEGTLVTVEQYVPGQDHVSIASLRGVAMLGLAEGNCLEVELEEGTETLAIIQVLSQPEAERKNRGGGQGLRLVSSREGSAETAPLRRPIYPSDDDPGPSAA